MGVKLRTLLLALVFSASAHAASIERPLSDAAQEQTARHIFHALKCVVCEGQSLAESDAVLARQMRDHVRSMIAQGKSEPEILEYFRAQYGDQILLTPPLQRSTLLLWLTPLLLLGIGITLLRRMTRGDRP
ncbi:MAG: cytochrome c-type biogenesis protein CcmH [Pseudomonadota bacterium]